jgi:hypothetical protein
MSIILIDYEGTPVIWQGGALDTLQEYHRYTPSQPWTHKPSCSTYEFANALALTGDGYPWPTPAPWVMMPPIYPRWRIMG